jgi:zinc/manganese transport system permease protein
VWSGVAIPEAASAGTAFAFGQATLLPVLGLPAIDPAPSPMLCALVATAAAVLWLVPVGRALRRGGERAAAACFLLAATAAVLFVSQHRTGTEEVRAFATGQTLLFLTPADLTLLAWACPALLLVAAALAGPVAHAAFDRDHARAQGRRVVAGEAALAGLLFALVAIAVPRAGTPFVFSHLVLPAAAAERLAARPLPTVLVAAGLGLVGYGAAAAAAVAFDLPFSTAAAGGALATAGLVIGGRAVVERLARLRAR